MTRTASDGFGVAINWFEDWVLRDGLFKVAVVCVVIVCLSFLCPMARSQPVSAHDAAQYIASIHGLVSQVAREQGITDAVAHQLVKRESGYRVNAIGRAGEIGLVQIKYATARSIGYRGSRAGLFDPHTNLTYGFKYMKRMGSVRCYMKGC